MKRDHASQTDDARRAWRGLQILVLIGAALLATHEGEFWPYSVYPMFSVAGRPWDRVIVRAVPEVPHDGWSAVRVEELPGAPVALEEYGVGQNDLADFIKLTRVWDDARIAALRVLLARAGKEHALVVYRVRGDVDAQGHASTQSTPVIWLGTRQSALNPALAPHAEVKL